MQSLQVITVIERQTESYWVIRTTCFISHSLCEKALDLFFRRFKSTPLRILFPPQFIVLHDNAMKISAISDSYCRMEVHVEAYILWQFHL